MKTARNSGSLYGGKGVGGHCEIFPRVQAWVLSSVLVLCVVVGTTRTEVNSFVVGSPLRSLSKRSFFDIQCKGIYDKGIFAKLDRVCDDCYNLYREPQLHALCSQKCFSTPYFIGCLDALTLSENEKEYQELILSINADNPLDDPIDSLEKPEPESEPGTKYERKLDSKLEHKLDSKHQ